jgi:deoxyribodipyrimidine photolyase-related protein
MNILILTSVTLFEEKIIKNLIKDYTINHIDFYELDYSKYVHVRQVYQRATLENYIDCVLEKLGISWKLKHIDNVVLAKSNKYYFIDNSDFNVNAKFKDAFMIETPMFIFNKNDLDEYVENRNNHKHSIFYKWVQTKFDLPKEFGLSKDKENRGSLNISDNESKKVINMDAKIENKNKYILNAIKNVKVLNNTIGYIYTETSFSEYPNYPTNHKDAKVQLDHFLKNKIQYFGKYQDAIHTFDTNFQILAHSYISNLLNIGLLTPKYVIEKTIKSYLKNGKKYLSSYEAFIRQILGWREYEHMIYIFYRNEILKLNYFSNTKKLPKIWYDYDKMSILKTNDTVVINPFNICVIKMLKYGYCHHIERLMILLNYMTLCEIKPSEICDWFTYVSIDSYEWVMLSNVYTMGFSSGYKFMSRPYISSLNYVEKQMTKKVQKIEIDDDLKWNEKYRTFVNRQKKK